MNKVILIGFVGNDPTTATFNNGDKEKAVFSLATSEKFGEKVYTTWHKVVAWNQLAKIVMNLLKKGSHVAVEGRIVYREVDNDGTKQYFTDIVAESVRVLDRAPKEDQALDPAPVEPVNTGSTRKGRGKPKKEDDLPF